MQRAARVAVRAGQPGNAVGKSSTRYSLSRSRPGLAYPPVVFGQSSKHMSSTTRVLPRLLARCTFCPKSALAAGGSERHASVRCEQREVGSLKIDDLRPLAAAMMRW